MIIMDSLLMFTLLFYAHAGAWYELVGKTLDHTVGLGTEKYNVGIVTAQTFVGGGKLEIVTSMGDVSNAVTSKMVIGANGTDDYTGPWKWITVTRHDPTIYLARGGDI